MRRTRVLDAPRLNKMIESLANRIQRQLKDTEQVALIGIKTRGEFLAKRIGRRLAKNMRVEIGNLDITLYRDDLNVFQEDLKIGESHIDFDLNGKIVVIVDDVLFSGRTVRAAIDQILDLGRPRVVRLAILLDRGHRELPIRPDFCGMKIRTEKTDRVEVRLKEKDGKDEAFVIRQ